MDIRNVLAQVDQLFEENRGEEAERLMRESAALAVQEGDDNSLLQLLNELVGYYREVSRYEDAYQIGDRAAAQARAMGLEGTVPYATTLLNVANAYRAGGRLSESLEIYLRVQEIYRRKLPPEDMLAAGLQNNMSLLYQEMGEYEKAKECQLLALQIVKAKGAAYELGVTYANLAATCVQLKQLDEAKEYAVSSMDTFRGIGVRDSHFGAALSALGTWHYRRREYEKAGECFRQAMEIVEQGVGRNQAYYRLQENAAACERALAACGFHRAGGEADSQAEKDIRADIDGEPEADSRAEGNSSPGSKNKAEVDNEMGADGRAGTDSEIGGDGRAGTDSRVEADNEIGEGGRAEVDSKIGADDRAEENSAGKVEKTGVGLELARAYYEAFGKPMIAEKFGAYEDRIAVGLVGRGSDCFGYDDAASRDHDWGPDFCMWVTDETYREIGEELQRAYEELPSEFQGYKRGRQVSGKGRRGVVRISEFYRGLVGADSYREIDWRCVGDASLAAAVNGEVFRDDAGVFTGFRYKLQQGYPEEIFYLKVAEAAARFSQAAQYNFLRVYGRGDELTARLMVWDGIREAMKLQLYLDGKYPPHDKWLHRALRESAEGREVAARLGEIQELLSARSLDTEKLKAALEELGACFALELYKKDIISDIDPYLDAHSEELIYKSSLASKSNEALVEDIAKLEFEAFDKVKNEGGRASCQNDWFTFSIMRKSQYLTWNRPMLLQYLYDFHREYHRGHNLIEEKYGRMMASTAPERYEEIKSHFPVLTEEKKKIIEQICGMQVSWMEEFAGAYPALADNARSIHTYEDNPFDTSYETYLRGELGTYSDKMLELYGRYIVDYARDGGNLAYDIMGNSVRMYGYRDIREAERKIREAMGL